MERAGLLLTGVLPGQDGLPDAQSPLVVARSEVVQGPLADLAGLAVAEPGAGAAAHSSKARAVSSPMWAASWYACP